MTMEEYKVANMKTLEFQIYIKKRFLNLHILNNINLSWNANKNIAVLKAGYVGGPTMAVIEINVLIFKSM